MPLTASVLLGCRWVDELSVVVVAFGRHAFSRGSERSEGSGACPPSAGVCLRHSRTELDSLLQDTHTVIKRKRRSRLMNSWAFLEADADDEASILEPT